MATSSPSRPTLVQDFEPLRPPFHRDASTTASQFASSSKVRTDDPPSSIQFPPSNPRCLRCRPILHQSHSTASIPTNHPADSTSIITPPDHVTVRHYIGPLPVPASAAKAIAKAIAEDGSVTANAESQGQLSEQDQTQSSQPDPEMDVKGVDYAESPSKRPSETQDSKSHTWTDPFSQSGLSQHQHNQQRSDESPSTSPKKKSTLLPPRRPRVVHRDPSSTSVLSNASFVSARSLARSALSDSETAQRGQTAFDLSPAAAVSTDASSPTPPPVSPSKKRFALYPKKSNQSFPISAAAGASLKPPTSILKTTASLAADDPARSDDDAAARNISNVRSADNLRVTALRQTRRIGSEGSPRSPISPVSSPLPVSDALPVLDLPLNDIEKALSDPAASQQMPNAGQTSHQNGMIPNGNHLDPDVERRAVNGSSDTTIVRSSDELRHRGSEPFLRAKTSFASVNKTEAADSRHAENAKPEDQNLLHPTWEQTAAAPVSNPDVQHDAIPNGSVPLSDAAPDTELENTQQSPTKASRNLVGRGLPIKKRSLTFSREPSVAHIQRSSTGMHLPRAVDHPREFSRQSRVSRASTAGTFNTVGTVATEGSFGATAGTSSSLARKFLAGGTFRRNQKRTDSMQPRNPRLGMDPTRTSSTRDLFTESSPSSIRTRKPASPFAVTRRRKIRSTSYASLQRDPWRRISANGTEVSLADSSSSTHAKGVQPGSVGTSGGGTKWVGESFQIGERFWHILNARREELRKSQPCTCGRASEGDADSSSEGSNASRQRQAEEHAAKVRHLKQSPDGVITLLAQEAQDVSDDKAIAAHANAHQDASKKLELEQRKRHSDLDVTRSVDNDKKKESTNVRRKLSHDQSAASIQTVHPDEATPVTIEARQGWSEIVSKMSSLTGELSADLKLGKSSRKASASSPDQSTPTNKPIASNGRQAGQPATVTAQNDASPRPPMDPDFKILARTSSLAESDKSSAASKSIYASLHPSTQANGFAPRASSLAATRTPGMTRSDALSHPAPPASVEASNPELVHQLLRRKSDLGERPDHLPDTASDHAVAIQPVSSPLSLTPDHVPSTPDSGLLQEQEPLPFETSPINEKGQSQPMSPGLLRAVGISNNAGRKKTVKFDTGSMRPDLKGRFTASLFGGKSADNQGQNWNGFGAAPGDAQPRPPREVLRRPEPYAMQGHGSEDTSTPMSERFGSETSIITPRSVLKKDRMLVKIAWTPHEDLPNDFDELQARKYTIRDEDWHEYVVVFRIGKLELWADPTLTNKLIGHGDQLKLRLTIPLSRGSTFVSLFSPIDRIFCLTFQPWRYLSAHHNKRGIHLRRQGTDIVLFDCRARSAAADWVWELWRELGGLIPESLEVHVPSFGLKVKIPVPESMPVERPDVATTPASQLSSEKGGLLALSSIGQTQEGGEGFKLINRNNVIAMIWSLFRRIDQWRDLMAESQKRGLRLELAWRRGNELDWVINERTVENEPRHWAVLCGALLRDYKQPSILELRVAAHYPTSVLAAPGQMMQEPPAVEGFLWRVKPVSGALTRLYFSTYDGHIYVCRISRAFPPDRHLAVQMQEAMDMRVPRTSGATQGRTPKAATPATTSALSRALGKFMGSNKSARRDEDVATLRQNVLEAISYPAETEEEFQGQIEAYQSFERRRQFEQIRGSDGFIDLKHIHTIKTIGSGPVRCPGEDDIRRPTRATSSPLTEKVQEDLAVAQRDDEESDDEGGSHAKTDIGGQEGLDLAEDANDVRRARQIEITLTNGKSIRLEAFSAAVAWEWVERIDALVKYWRRRERADATELMYAAGADITKLHAQLQGRTPHSHGLDGDDEQKLSPILGNLWNWCQIEGCRNIIRSGRLFHKKSSYSAFKSRDYVLIAGRLICFKLVNSVRTTRARQNNGIFHRRQDTVIHLRDAYVYSGKLSEDMLKNGRSDPAQAVSGIGGGGSNSGKRHRVPRVYADGLFSVDDDEDCTFVIRYRPERVNTPADPSVTNFNRKGGKSSAAGTRAKDKGDTQDTAYSLPRLDDKTHKYIAMRARSKTERDLWVRCITYEIEKIVREDVEREKKLKNMGKTIYPHK